MFSDDITWKGRLIRFFIYVLVGFLCAFLSKYL